MKKNIALLAFSLAPFCWAFGQKAVLHIALANSTAKACYLDAPARPKNAFSEVPLVNKRTAVYTIALTRPEFVQLTCLAGNDWGGKSFTYLVYLSPEDDLHLSADMNKAGFGIKVRGKGSNKNQPLLALNDRSYTYAFYKDTLPKRIIGAINATQNSLQNKLSRYVARYKPSAGYVEAWKMNIQYYAADMYYSFKENNKFQVEDAYRRNYAQWQRVADSLSSLAKLNNDAALGAFYYQKLAIEFLGREKEHFSDEAYFHPTAFYRQWYHADTVEGKKLFDADGHNGVEEKIINKYFSGKTAEYLYANLLAGAHVQQNPKNIPEIFDRFRELYPGSKYIGQFSGWVDTVKAKQKRGLNSRMLFFDGNGTSLKSLDEVLAAMKGKTVLVDMWGTWCGPCREEIEKNSAAIRAHFKDKRLIYLYIANLDTGNEAQWKKLIAYFGIEGTHLLASQKLTDNIMTRIKGNGYPTMFIIKKDGTVEPSKTAYPIDRDVLFKQLEADLEE
jgi:thiol-disulfide isomerase/thioredoxin